MTIFMSILDFILWVPFAIIGRVAKAIVKKIKGA